MKKDLTANNFIRINERPYLIPFMFDKLQQPIKFLLCL